MVGVLLALAAAGCGSGAFAPQAVAAEAECASYEACLEIARQQVDAYEKSARSSGVPQAALTEQVARIEEVVLGMEARMPTEFCAADSCPATATADLELATRALFALLPPPCGPDSCEPTARPEMIAIKSSVETFMYRLAATSSDLCGSEGCNDEVSEMLAGLGDIAVRTSFASIPPPCDVIENLLGMTGLCDMIEDPANYVYWWESVLLEHFVAVAPDSEDLPAIAMTEAGTARSVATETREQRVVIGGGGQVIERAPMPVDATVTLAPGGRNYQCVYSTGQNGFYAYAPSYSTIDHDKVSIYGIHHLYKQSRARSRTVSGVKLNTKQFEACTIVSGSSKGGNKLWRAWGSQGPERKEQIWIGRNWGTSGANGTASASLGFTVADPRIPVSISGSVPVGNDYTYTGRQGEYDPASDVMVEEYRSNQFTGVWQSPHTWRWQGSTEGQGNVVQSLYELYQTDKNPGFQKAVGGNWFCGRPFGAGCS
jgi:hypothetical protein